MLYDENSTHKHKYWDDHTGLLVGVLSGAIGLGTTLILGSYGYTWVEIKSEQEEKRIWRNEYNKELDKKFEEVKERQEKLTTMVHENNTQIKDMLVRILNEQARLSQRRK